MVIVIGIITAVVCAVLGEAIGKPKGRRDVGGILGFLLGPVGLLIIASMSETEEHKIRVAQERMRVEQEAARRLQAEMPGNQRD